MSFYFGIKFYEDDINAKIDGNGPHKCVHLDHHQYLIFINDAKLAFGHWQEARS